MTRDQFDLGSGVVSVVWKTENPKNQKTKKTKITPPLNKGNPTSRRSTLN
jgi:hypothetical protein